MSRRAEDPATTGTPTSGTPTSTANDRRRGREPRKRFWVFAALAGIVSGGALLAVAELVALVVARQGSPILALGSFVIDIVPRWAKEFAIEAFGANDKLFLLLGLGLAVVVAAAIAGILQLVRPPLGLALLGLAAVLSVLAIVTRAGAVPLASVPTIIGALVAGYLMHVMFVRLRGWRAATLSHGSSSGSGTGGNGSSTSSSRAKTTTTASESAEARASVPAVDRRVFFRIAGFTAVGAAIVGTGARVVNAATSSLAKVRDAIALPTPGATVATPAGAELDVPGISSLFTSNADFYRVDTALTVPSIDPDTWSLKITGMVDQEVTLSFQDLVDMGVDEYAITLTCVSNQVGGNLLGTAKWLGLPVRDILKMAGPQSGADMVLSQSVDGYTASTPLESLTDDGLDAILAIGMNGEPLPFEHGFPVRMIVPGLYGYVSATKWLTELKVTTFDADQAYWTPRGYDAKAPIKLSSRIDTPRVDKAIDAAPTKIAGVAWAQTVGIETVEVSIDNGEWQKATLSAPLNKDTWVQWYLDWTPDSGTHYLAVRATDKNGTLQIEERAPIAPNGSSGWQRTLVTVT